MFTGKVTTGFVIMATELQRINAKHQQLIRMHVAGLDIGRIEKALGFCAGYGSKILNSPMVQDKIKEMQEELDDFNIKAIDDSRAIIMENASKIAANLVHLSLNADKQELQVSAGIKALQFAEGGKEEEVGSQQLLKIFIRNDAGVTKPVDIFASAYVEKEGGELSPEEEERSALETMEDMEDGATEKE